MIAVRCRGRIGYHQSMPQPLQHVVTAAQAGRIDHIVHLMTNLPRRRITALFQRGCVRLNGASVAEDFARVGAGDRVEVTADIAQGAPRPVKAWQSGLFRLVYEDDHLLVVDKAAHALTVPTGPTKSGSLHDAVNDYLGRGGGKGRSFVVHRLDRGVSGLLMLAKSNTVAQQLKEQFAAHKPKRLYLALVAGRLAADHGSFRSHLATGGNLDRYSTPDTEHGQLAVTHYRVQKLLKDTTLVQVQLETGRRNQIRVHFAEAGHPVLGDPRYRPDQAAHPQWRTKRLALHAVSLALVHPATGKKLSYESPLPEPMRAFMQNAG